MSSSQVERWPLKNCEKRRVRRRMDDRGNGSTARQMPAATYSNNPRKPRHVYRREESKRLSP
eukprot:CAMPEP_0167828054 /NCGR_PEP_ID=MMETSP0112_2-20121227/11129_1 /TAXON_ID=91324 /ORGANISM="Lotharella globosa, Strain CCCM811" /LENGTH=61 /DNA_ID=CAMNT_0007731071 /DNA_START=1095 /DNA_END=1280 /DNA_ORIENTATION=+